MFLDPWRCRDCNLEIGNGLAHARGYFATLFACRNCGTTHAIENQYRLRYLPEPYFADPGSRKSTTQDNGNSTLTVMWFPVNWPQAEGEFSEDDIDKMLCTYCNAGELTKNWTADDLCPSCGGEMIRKRDLSK